jgi:hypothetical protein
MRNAGTYFPEMSYALNVELYFRESCSDALVGDACFAIRDFYTEGEDERGLPEYWTHVQDIPIIDTCPICSNVGFDIILAAVGVGKVKYCNCFLADTDVLMADGTTKDIEDVDIGDHVLATDPETGHTEKKPVTALIGSTRYKYLNELSITTPDGVEQLVATHEHPFWSPSEGAWIEAGDLEAGVTLRTDEGVTVVVTANRAYEQVATTYNLTIADIHTYYVLAGETPVLVHNSGPGCGSIWIDSNKVPHHFKHAEDFGITGKESKATKQAFVNALESFVRNPGNVQITGTYRGAAARHYVDPNTGRHVSVDLESGQMLGAWRSDPTSDQFRYLMEQGKL